jgi:hypothetical protein
MSLLLITFLLLQDVMTIESTHERVVMARMVVMTQMVVMIVVYLGTTIAKWVTMVVTPGMIASSVLRMII